ncbi:hypothetical protein NIES2107_49680 [Nostoc carneum NIES-2107]|nr:hypothetical protein NIES2107_49680 [Nostoc carneum NIES-2107]
MAILDFGFSILNLKLFRLTLVPQGASQQSKLMQRKRFVDLRCLFLLQSLAGRKPTPPTPVALSRESPSGFGSPLGGIAARVAALTAQHTGSTLRYFRRIVLGISCNCERDLQIKQYPIAV